MPISVADNEFFIDFEDDTETLDSDGNELSSGQVSFFKNSKCRDDLGALYLLYRAANQDYDIFDVSKIGTGAGSIYGKGFYFSLDKLSVEPYGNIVKEYYLNFKNPFIYYSSDEDLDKFKMSLKTFLKVLKTNGYPVDKELANKLYRDARRDGGLDTIIEATCGFEKATDFFQKCNFDGIMNLEIGDFVAYYPEQIKLRTNRKPAVSANSAL